MLSQNVFQEFFQNAATPCVVVDSTGLIHTANHAWLRHTGLQAEDLERRNFLDFVHSDDRKRLHELLKSGLTQGSFECRLRQYGEYRWTRIEPRTQSGDLSVYAIVPIIPEQSTGTISQSDAQRYRVLFESNPNPMWMYDRETLRFLEVNDAAVEVYGYSRDEFLNMTILDIRPAEEVPRTLEAINNLRTRYRSPNPWRHKTKQGRVFEVEVASHDIEFAGRPARIVVAHEMDARYQLALERESHAQKLRKLAETFLATSLTYAVEDVLQIITDQAREIIGAHQAVTSLTIDQKWSQSISAVSLSEKYARWQKFDVQPDGTGIYAEVCRTNRPMRLTQRELEAHPLWRSFGKYADEHPPMRGWLAVPLIDHERRNIGLIQLSDKFEGDFTEDDETVAIQFASLAALAIENARLYAELETYAEILEQRVEERTRELQRANDRLQELDRMKSRFISEVSHELRNPIASLSFKVELMKRGGGESFARHLPGLEEQVNRLLELIASVLDLSRLELGRDRVVFSVVDLNDIVLQLADIYQQNATAHGITLHVNIDPRIPQVRGERTQLTQVLTNLLSNAIKYNLPNGEIFLSTFYDADTASVGVSIHDTGIGIPREDIPFLFDRFFRAANVAERDIPGTGLGLPIVHEIVKLHLGRIEVESELGKGTTFRVYIPVADG